MNYSEIIKSEIMISKSLIKCKIVITQWELKVPHNVWRKDYWGYVRPRTE